MRKEQKDILQLRENMDHELWLNSRLVEQLRKKGFDIKQTPLHLREAG